MSLLDKFIAAVTPPETQEARIRARAKAREAATPGDWLSFILHHHLAIEAAFTEVKSAADVGTRQFALKALGVVLTGHAIAEESVIYPALAEGGDLDHAQAGYSEQATVKVHMSALEAADPMSEGFLDMLERIREEVAHHMYQEEGDWFPRLKAAATPAFQKTLARDYQERFDRYVGVDRQVPTVAEERRSWDDVEPRA